MQAQDFLRSGDLDQALASLKDEVRSQPAEVKHRVFLFQLMAVLGDWERALNQLNVAGELDAETFPMVQAYREVLQCEALRGEVFAGQRSATLFGEPAEWSALYVQALSLAGDEANKVRAQALELAPDVAGNIDGKPFEWLIDGDSRIGPIVEAVVNGVYYWIPMQHIKRIKFEAPEDLRDMVWLPATFEWRNEGQAVGFVPVRYAGSERSGDAQIQLSRKTEWQELGDEQFSGLGQRMLMTPDDEVALLDIREIEFD